ncbi:MAG: hypothetical protein D6722_03810 [Bacteroidetes bacterium]|nr:MAG: hypothetical protein D6722_03810 [Bacteroidota bacterium]
MTLQFPPSLFKVLPRKRPRTKDAAPDIAPRGEKKILAPTYLSILMDLSEVNEAQIKAGTRFKEDLGLDSLDMVEMVMICEKEFHVILVDQDWVRLRTVGEFWDMLNKKRRERAN